MKIIIDTNIWISFLLGKRLAFLKEVFYDKNIDIYMSEILINEIRDVIKRPKFKGKIDTESTKLLFEIIDKRCKHIDIPEVRDIEIRDKKDIFILTMARCCKADYIISGDEDLLVIHIFEGTKILKFSEFISLLANKHDTNH